jgi:two-component system, LytTR family, sensor kinase
MIAEGALARPLFNDATRKLAVSCAVFSYFVGLLGRLPLLENKVLAVAYSFALDTIVVVLGVASIRLVMRSRLSDLNVISLGVVLVGAAVGAVLMMGVAWFVRFVAPAFPHPSTPALTIFLYYGFVFSMWGIAAFWVKTQMRAVEEAVHAANAERAAALSELRRLRMQLDPHFIFNALNTALVEVSQKPARAVRMLRELSSYLRYSLDTADMHLMPIAAELAMIRSFLRVQDIRFGARLKSSVTAEEQTKRRLIPTFLLLPLVENATKYGIPNDDNVLEVDVSVSSDGDATVIKVTNTGELSLARPGEFSTRTGLSNLRARLALHYPDRHSFDMAQVGDRVSVTCVLQGEPC